MYIIILLLIVSFSSVEITAMKRTAADAITSQTNIIPQLEKAEALIKKYGALDQLNDSSKSIISDKLEEIFCTSPLFKHVTRQNVIFEKNDESNLLPILHPLEKLCYPYLQEVPFRSQDCNFYTHCNTKEFIQIFNPFKEQFHLTSLGVFVQWIYTASKKKEDNLTRALLNKLSNEPKIQYVITPQTSTEHSNLVITRLSPSQLPCAFLFDSLGKGKSHITYLAQCFESEDDCSWPTLSNITYKVITPIDASLKIELALQKYMAHHDYNCHFYAYNYTQAAKDFFLNQTSPEFKAFEELCTQERFEEAGAYLHQALMPLLPLYFRKDENGHYVAKSADELMQVHLRARWEEGNKYLKERAAILYPQPPQQQNNQE
jgi:hypothetical protein